jgi:hypothetical protein
MAASVGGFSANFELHLGNSRVDQHLSDGLIYAYVSMGVKAMTRDATSNPSSKPLTRSRFPYVISGILSALSLHANAEARNVTPPAAEPTLNCRCIRIKDKVCEGMRIGDLRCISELGITVSQILPRKNKQLRTVTSETCLRQGDMIVAIGRSVQLDAFCDRVGGQSTGIDFLGYVDNEAMARRLNEIKPQ